MKELNCKTGLEAGIISEEVFKKELGICEQLSQGEKESCCWGKCEDCGVVPLLYKLHKGELLEGKEEILTAKKTAGLVIKN